MRTQKRGFRIASALFFLLIFLGVFSILISAQEASPAQQAKGCYFYPQGSLDFSCKAGGVTKEIAQEDCAAQAGCKLADWFKPGSTCSDIPDCKKITCDASNPLLTCKEVPLGACTQAGGKEIPLTEKAIKCTKGCCFVPLPEKPYCHPVLVFEPECKNIAGLKQTDKSNYKFYNSEDVAITPALCEQLYCQAAVAEGSLMGLVKDVLGQPVASAVIEILGTTKTTTADAAGKYSFLQVVPATYSLKVSAAGYIDLIQAVSVSAGEAITKDLTLQKTAGEAALRIKVSGVNSKALAGITVNWKGPVQGIKKTDAQGEAVVSNLPTGAYTILISAIGYVSQEVKKNLDAGETLLEITLSQAAFQGVKGSTFVNNKKTYGVSIYVDGLFKAKSQYGGEASLGAYSISLPADEKEHTISAAYQDFVSEIKKIAVQKDQIVELDLYLSPLKGECTPAGTNPQKAVSVFAAKSVLGKKEVRLEWEKPCPEVKSYTIQKSEGETVFPAQTIAGTLAVIIDNQELEWGKTYTYTIFATFDSGLSSQEKTNATITLGDKECAGRFIEDTGTWSSFCLIDIIDIIDKTNDGMDRRQTIYTCTEQNNLAPVQECSSLGSTWFCAPTSSISASCKDAGICLANTAPFGLYAEEEACYGTNNDNFCYYDYSSKTIANQCASCAAVPNCFAYRSKSACKKNNCLSAPCAWVDVAANPLLIDYSYLYSNPVYSADLLGQSSSNPQADNSFGSFFGNFFNPLMTSAETGAGYCVEKEYSQDDQCSLCSPGSNFSENYFCTPDVCSNLGRCFANPEQTSCEQCQSTPSPDATCYSYTSATECAGAGAEVSAAADASAATAAGIIISSGITKDELGRLSLSQDRCSWGRCAWDGVRCFKDGNVDKKDDCADVKGSQIACAVDNTPPTTSIEDTVLISMEKPSLTFTADDSSPKAGQGNFLKSLSYCLSPEGETNSCVTENFVSVKFKGLSQKESISVNVANFPSLAKANPAGQIFTIHYFSEDIFSNREQLKTGALYVDILPPQFTVKEELSTQGITSQLAVHLEDLNEPASCNFSLQQVLPLGDQQTQTAALEEPNKEAQFTELKGVKYTLTTTCTDLHGNKAVQKKDYSFDLEQNIEIIYPIKSQILAQTNIPFKVKTILSAICVLYDTATNQKIADFHTDEESLVHETAPVSLIEQKYVAEHKVVCTELLSGKSYEDYFDFTIDFTPPAVKASLQEGSRIIEHEEDGWKESFISQAAVTLFCSSEGFPCQQINYCLEETCSPADLSLYKPYTNTFVVDSNSKICYYATQEEKTLYNDISCGEIIIDGFGITLEKPKKHTYLGEMWGVSNSPFFDWQFFTKIPAQECRFDFLPQYDYASLAKYKVKEKNAEGKYLFEKFPESVFSSYPEKGGVKTVYVTCQNAEGELSPVQKMSLEYDPTPPQILSFSTSPEPVIEGISTLLKVTTDDKTICTFTDKGSGKIYPFPGADERKLNTAHEAAFYVDDFVGDKKEYALGVVCENGAGVKSAEKEVLVHVDYTQKGSIISIFPKDAFFQNGPVTAEVITSKIGYCEYKKGEEYALFTETKAKVHKVSLNSTEEKKYIIPFRCFFGDAEQEGEFSFTIDRHPPLIESIEDGTFSCGNDSWSILVKTNETKIVNYSYSIYNATLSTPPPMSSLSTASSSTSLSASSSAAASASSLSSSNKSASSSKTAPKEVQKNTVQKNTLLNKGSLLLEGSINADSPLEIPFSQLGLSNYEKYYSTSSNDSNFSTYSSGMAAGVAAGLVISIKVTDAAGNIGLPKDSDGIILSNSSHPTCKGDNKLPVVTVSTVNSSSCSSRLVSLNCGDATACTTFFYGVNASAETCQPTLPYSGKNIEVTSTSYVCHSVKDAAGNSKSSSNGKTEAALITFEDKDGDKIADSCDICSGTLAGKIVDEEGCAAGQVSSSLAKEDSDGDGLPDAWENQFNSLTCQLSPVSKDSDGNGVADGQEDYDKDTLVNSNEYISGKNPCAAEVVETAKPEEETEGLAPREEEAVPSSLTAWVLLLLGIVLFLGGLGYLIYSYLVFGGKPAGGTPRGISYPPFGEAGRGGQAPSAGRPSAASKPAVSEQFAAWKKARREKAKQKEREAVFERFGSKKASAEEKEAGKREEAKETSKKEVSKESSGALVSGEKTENVFEKLRQIGGKKKKD